MHQAACNCGLVIFLNTQSINQTIIIFGHTQSGKDYLTRKTIKILKLNHLKSRFN